MGPGPGPGPGPGAGVGSESWSWGWCGFRVLVLSRFGSWGLSCCHPVPGGWVSLGL
jgi:hypothetical protein